MFRKLNTFCIFVEMRGRVHVVKEIDGGGLKVYRSLQGVADFFGVSRTTVYNNGDGYVRDGWIVYLDRELI